ncbi:MAG: hypothetical protein ACYTJ0_17325 [Planctomycetota bacterium]|jgi:hypothetical protein
MTNTERSRRDWRGKRLNVHGAGAALVLACGAAALIAQAQAPLVAWGRDNTGRVSGRGGPRP